MTGRQWGRVVGLAWVVLVGGLALSPALLNPWSDSSAYAYVAQVIRDGGLPYRDAWDHKPPLIYALDALSFSVFGENRWAVWALERVLVFVTGLLLYGLLRAMGLRTRLAGAGTLGAVLLLCRSLWVGLNTPEMAALPFQVITLWAGLRLLRDPRDRWALIAGGAAGLALLGKQTTCGAVVAFVPAVALAQRGWLRQHVRPVIVLLASVGIAPGIAALYLAARGGLPDAVEAILVYNRYHLHSFSVSGWVRSTTDSQAVLALYGPLAYFALVGVLFRRLAPAGGTFVLWLALTCGADFALTNSSARGYPHYFLTPLAAFVPLALVGLAWWLDQDWLRSPRGLRRATWAYLALLVLVPPILELAQAVAVSGGHLWGSPRRSTVAAYVRDHTRPGDFVLNWGHANDVNFGADRRSPSHYFYSLPLVMEGFATPARVRAFVDEVQAHPPVLIVDASYYELSLVPPLDPDRLADWIAQGGRPTFPDLTPLYRFVAAHCAVETSFDFVTFYRCTYLEPVMHF